MKAIDLCCRLLHKEEANALVKCVKLLPDNPVIVQIGASKGISTVNMLEARPDAFIFSIDIAECSWERESIDKIGLDHRRVVRVLGDSSQMDWPVKVDMVYFDGNHTYEGVKADCDTWLCNIKKNGLAVFHDYVLVGGKPTIGVYKVVDSIFDNQKPFVRGDRIIGFKI